MPEVQGQGVGLADVQSGLSESECDRHLSLKIPIRIIFINIFTMLAFAGGALVAGLVSKLVGKKKKDTEYAEPAELVSRLLPLHPATKTAFDEKAIDE